MTVGELPSAAVHGRPWSRMLAGPARATSSWIAWAVSFAITSSLLHAAYFLTLALDWSRSGALYVLFLVLTVSIQWTVSCAAFALISPLGFLLARWPRPLARVAGAAVSALVAIAIERVAAGAYLSFEDDLWRHGFWILAVAIGAIWGAWLPVAGARSAAT